MIKILIVEDNDSKLENIQKIIFENSNIKPEYVSTARCMKEAKKILYDHFFDLMILDLVIPNEIGDDAMAENGISLLNDIQSNPMIKPPIHIIGLTGYPDIPGNYDEKFRDRLWHLITYEADATGWHDQLKAIIFHLVKMRQTFIKARFSQSFYDVAIITALAQPELEAVFKLGDKPWEQVVIEGEITHFYRTDFEKDGKLRTIIAAHADQMGMVGSSQLATKMTIYFQPKYLVMAGIAAGIKDRGLGFGDILIAEQVWDYGSGKMVEPAKADLKAEGANALSEQPIDVIFEPDLRPIQLSSELKAKVSHFLLTHRSILDQIQNSWMGETPRSRLSAFLGPVASGSYVISNSTTLAEIKEQQRKLLGIEMEAYGVYYAAERTGDPKTQAIAIKSVTDYGDGEKNDKFQKYAAYTSAQFVYHFVMKCL